MLESAISLIIPTYNVADFIEPCLASLKAQTLTNYDVVIVNDGSTDDSAAIARACTAGDDRFTVIDQTNSGPGPGGGRNGGLGHTRSDRLMFIDSDDALLPDTLHKLVTAFDTQPGLDMVTTSGARLLGALVRPSHLHDMSHPRAQARTTAAKSPWLMFDSTPWNKVFRRQFFDDVVGRWPEQQLYEDIAPMTKATLAAEEIAVLTDRHYLWRIRGEGSITHAQTHIRGDLAQLDQLAIARHAVIQTDNPDLLRWFDWKSITQDLLWMTRKLITIPVEHRRDLHAAIRTAVAVIDPALVASTQPALRRCYDSILNRSPRHSTRQVVQSRVGLMQDRRSPDQALAAPFRLVSLQRQQHKGDSLSFWVSSTSVDLRGAQLYVQTSPPWAPAPRRIVGSVPASRSSRRFAQFSLNPSDIAEAGRLAAGSKDFFVEVVDGGGRATEITRSLVDAVKRRFQPHSTSPGGPLAIYFDDGRVRLTAGTAVPTISAACMRDDDLVLTGSWPVGTTSATEHVITFTSSEPGEFAEVTWSFPSANEFCVSVPPQAQNLWSMQPTWISLAAANNPAIAQPFGVLSTLTVEQPGSSSQLVISAGQFGEATIRLSSTPATRLRALAAEASAFVPASRLRRS